MLCAGNFVDSTEDLRLEDSTTIGHEARCLRDQTMDTFRVLLEHELRCVLWSTFDSVISSQLGRYLYSTYYILLIRKGHGVLRTCGDVEDGAT